MNSIDSPFLKSSTLTYRTKNRLQNCSEAGFFVSGLVGSAGMLDGSS